MKLKDIPKLLPKKEKILFYENPHTQGYKRARNVVIDEIGEEEIELDVEKIYEKISFFQVFQGLGTATVYQDSLYKFIGKENCHKLAQVIAKANVIKTKEKR